MSEFMSVTEVAKMLKEKGSPRSIPTLRVFITRKAGKGEFPGAYKTGDATAMWLIPRAAVEEWIDAS